MGWFSKKKEKRGTTLTDEERELALERKKELRDLRHLRYQKERVEHLLELEQAKADLAELIGEDEDENFLGLGSQEMQLLNIFTKGKANDFLQNPTSNAGNDAATSITPPTAELEQQAQQIAAALPAPLIKQLKSLNPDAVKRAVDIIKAQP